MPLEPSPKPSPPARRDLEYDYLVLSYEVAALLELRLQESVALESLELILTQARECLSLAPTPEERELLAEILDLALRQAESQLRLGRCISRFPDEFRRLNQALAQKGASLGYRSSREQS